MGSPHETEKIVREDVFAVRIRHASTGRQDAVQNASA
jgi:hypothetical protein